MAARPAEGGRKTSGPTLTASTEVASPPPWRIPASWTWTTVARVGAVRLGRQRSPETESAAFPTKYLRAANITPQGLNLDQILEMDFDEVERQIYGLRAGDVVLTEASGSALQVGRAAIWSGEIPECCFQNTVIRFRPHAVIPEYALLVFQHLALSGSFAQVARGVGIQHLGVSPFSRMQFPLPPLAEQQRIAREASLQLQQSIEACDSIESALARTDQQDNAILEAAALGGLVDPSGADQVVLPSETEAKADPGLFPEDGANPDLPNPEFSDLMSRRLPVGWRWVRVDQAGEVRMGRSRSPENEYGEHMVPYLRVANVLEDRIDATELKTMNFTPKEQAIYRLRPGDILLNEGQSPELVGRPALYTGEPPEVFYQNHLIRFRHTPFVNPRYALLVFRHYLRSGQFTRVARWSTNIANLGVSRLAAMPFPLPPPTDQDRIVAEAYARLDASKAQRVSIESSLKRLDDMRRGIIRSAVSGNLVPQKTADESAEDLLARLGPPPHPKPVTEGKERRMARRTNKSDQPAKQLYETILGLKGPVPPERLFEAAGYDRDSVADVEKFYLALREELDVRIRKRTSEAGVRLEVIKDAAR